MNVSGEEEEEKYLRDPTHCALNLLMLSGGEEEIVEEDFLSSEIFYCQMAGDSRDIVTAIHRNGSCRVFFFCHFPISFGHIRRF
jgi:hypothetical protein